MRTYITFSVCHDSGEADLTPASARTMEKWASNGDLWDMDVLGDISAISESLYLRCRDEYRAQWELLREAAQVSDE